ncbi:hypothetical protein [Methanotorris formicicus]|uniref:Uncharacterized protein n=1 Tax=Methanotorris formicicus Mc-S-70 TaxID=647171 RepID=H1KWE7_9EURY|nr:hypothetical protein [Methanotorris formicicus]EHP89524.1 hypothetical protein MetfoDRAFT_0120 [Methanotorris formicicus Mc-S-70]
MYTMKIKEKELSVKCSGGNIVLELREESGEEISSMTLDKESAALFSVLLNEGIVTAEKINKDFKKDGVILKKIQDVGTCFASDGRLSIAVLPADEKRTASMIIGMHKEDEHASIVMKPKKAAYLSLLIVEVIKSLINKN